MLRATLLLLTAMTVSSRAVSLRFLAPGKGGRDAAQGLTAAFVAPGIQPGVRPKAVSRGMFGSTQGFLQSRVRLGPIAGIAGLNMRGKGTKAAREAAKEAEAATTPTGEGEAPASRTHFISNMIKDDLESGKHKSVLTRFPPEPNGYLHLGHAKSVNLNYGIAKEYGGVTNMRFDDTNPVKEDQEYVDSIKEDVRWLVSGSTDGPDPWDGEVRHASDYFETFYEAAKWLISKDLAYVEELSADEMREYRGTLKEPGRNSPFRDRPKEESMDLFERMRAGEFEDGSMCLRAKIDMSSSNMNMRDPALYRIRRATHVMTGDKWCIYPMYDYAHCLSDALEGITHSLCTLEFEDHRPLYDWFVDKVLESGLIEARPRQTEFSRLNLQYTVLSKRKLIQLVEEKHVEGWSDPRMPTLSGVRRRGYTPEALRLFCERVGISKADSNIDMSVLEDCAREVLEQSAPRALAVLDPIKLTITNWPEGKVEEFETDAHPKRPELGTRKIPFSGSVLIDAEDFNEDPPKGYFRLSPGGQVRLRLAYVVTCNEVVRDADGKVKELLCTYDPETRAGATPEGAQKVKGIIQWVSEGHGVPCEVRLYDRLFKAAQPGADHDGDFLKDINPDSVRVCKGFAEPSVAAVAPGGHVQFERVGYFCADSVDSKEGALVFNRVVPLRDTWAAKTPPSPKAQKGQQQAKQGGGGGAGPAQADLDPVLRLDIRVGKILSAEKHPDADSLYVEKIDLGDETGPRTIVSGLANYIPLEDLEGRACTVLCNLKPAKMRGILSEGMVLCAADDDAGVVELLEPPEGAEVGERVKVEGRGEPQPDEVLKSKTQQKVWTTVAEDLKTDDEGAAVFQGDALITSAGKLTSKTLKGKPIS